jgi:hypothetical protein
MGFRNEGFSHEILHLLLGIGQQNTFIFRWGSEDLAAAKYGTGLF